VKVKVRVRERRSMLTYQVVKVIYLLLLMIIHQQSLLSLSQQCLFSSPPPSHSLHLPTVFCCWDCCIGVVDIVDAVDFIVSYGCLSGQEGVRAHPPIAPLPISVVSVLPSIPSHL